MVEVETRKRLIKELRYAEKQLDRSGEHFIVVPMTKKHFNMIVDALERLRPCETEGKVASDNTENRSPYAATVDGMLSPDYRERFRAEYQQTKIRYEKLKAFNNKILVAKQSEAVKMPAHDCPDNLLREQQEVMGEYLRLLEIRAVFEGIEL